jgi:hypothetical protein
MDKPNSRAPVFTMLSHDELIVVNGGQEFVCDCFMIPGYIFDYVMRGQTVEGGWSAWHA